MWTLQLARPLASIRNFFFANRFLLPTLLIIWLISWDGTAPPGATAGRSEVLAYNSQPVQVQYDHQEVLDGEENKHLVEDIEVGHNGEPDHQERPILDKQGFNSTPHVRAVFSEEGDLLDTLLSLTIWIVVHHY